MSIVYKNASLRGKTGLFRITAQNGYIKDIKPETNELISKEYKVYDCKGCLVSSPYCDTHIHLDYVFTANSFKQNTTGTLFDGIASWSQSKEILTTEDIKERAKQGLKEQILSGTQFIRTHVDVTDHKLTALKAILQLKQDVKEFVDIQIVAFPPEGMYSYIGGDELVEEALKMGADVVGVIPHFEFTRELGEKSVKKAIELAIKYDKLIDIHCDETDDEQSRFIELLASEAFYHGIGEKTTASHACAMGSYNNAYAFKLLKLLKTAKINIISCPTENIHLQGRYDTYPKRRGLTRVDELTKAGVNVCFAQDSICDPWYPLGNGDLMHILDFGLHLCHMMTPEQISNALDFITINGAKTLNLANYGLEIGKPESLIVLNATNEFEAVRNRADVILSVHNGKVLFEKEPLKLKNSIFSEYIPKIKKIS